MTKDVNESLDKQNKESEVSWETLPEDDEGLYTKRGLSLGEEPHVIHLSGPRLAIIWRTELGIMDVRYSKDYGLTWQLEEIKPLTYTTSQNRLADE